MPELHNRIPVMIEEENRAGWLGEEPVDANALASSPDNNLLTIWLVNRAVENVRNNDPALLEAVQ